MVSHFLLRIERSYTYPDVAANDNESPYIVEAKLGAKSWLFCVTVMTAALLAARANVINARQV